MKILFTLHLLVFSAIGIAQEIDRAEYFINFDFGPGNCSPIQIDTSNQVNITDFPISVAGLEEDGLHRLHLRYHTYFVDDTGGVHDYWSMPEGRYFHVIESGPNAVDSLNVVAAKYWFDNEEWAAVDVDFTDSIQASIAALVPVDLLQADGMHTFALSYQDNQGRWSMPEHRYFWVLPIPIETERIIAAEYYFNDDPGLGNADSVGLPHDLEWDEPIEEVIDVSACQAAGVYNFCIRYMDNDSNWSAPECATIHVADLPTLTIRPMNQSILLSWCADTANAPFYVYKTYITPPDTHFVTSTMDTFFVDVNVLNLYQKATYHVRQHVGPNSPLSGRRSGMGKMLGLVVSSGLAHPQE